MLSFQAAAYMKYIFNPCCCCCSIYKISFEGSPRTTCNLNFYFRDSLFLNCYLWPYPFQGNLCRLLTNNCFTLHTLFMLESYELLPLGTFPESKSMAIFDRQTFDFRKNTYESGFYKPNAALKIFVTLHKRPLPLQVISFLNSKVNWLKLWASRGYFCASLVNETLKSIRFSLFLSLACLYIINYHL